MNGVDHMNLFNNPSINQEQRDVSNTSSRTNINKTNSNPSTNNINTSSTTSALIKDATIKGEIVDIRNNEITIKLPSNKTLTAKISNPPELSIGQTASFKVVDRSVTAIYLEVIDKDSLPQNNTVNKALEGAGLTNNEQNLLVATTLLDNQMSIDKQSILNLLRMSQMHKDVSIDTLALMMKHNIPTTKENIQQFQQFQNQEHRIVKELSSYTNNIVELLGELSQTSKVSESINLHQTITDLMMKQALDTNQDLPNQDLINKLSFSKDMSLDFNQYPSSSDTKQITNVVFNSSNLFYHSDSLTTNIFSTEQRYEIVNLLEDYGVLEQLKSNIINGTIDLKEIANLLSDYPTLNTANPLLDTINETVSLSQSFNSELSSSSTTQQRNQLLAIMKNLDLPINIMNDIKTGTISNIKLIDIIGNKLGEADEHTIKDILNDPLYKSLLKKEFLSSLTLTPADLLKEGSPEKLYKNLSEHLDKFASLSSSNSGNLASSVSNTASQIKDNVDFMKTLNQMFTYIQLPLKLREQNIHSDLYVYTNKKQLQADKNNISVLLHLDMEHLGPTDIHITLNHQQVHSKFYLSDQLTKDLVEDNILRLKEALEIKGYTLKTEILKRDEDVDIVKDFIDKDTPTTSLKRYSFDIRA